MKDKVLKIIFILILLTSSVNFLYSEPHYDGSVSFQFDKISKDTIQDDIFGGFAEFLNDYINGPMGLWAQDLQDRGFDYIIDDTNHTSYFWQYWNSDNVSDSIALEKDDKYNENGLFSQLIEKKSGIGFTGIRQRILISDTVTHTFYIYARSTGIPLRIQFLDTNQNLVYERKLETTENWRKYEFQVPKLNYNSLYIYFAISDDGKMLIDESSFMPDNNEYGIRAEYADIFRKWKPSVMRFPGGSFVSNIGGVWWTGIDSMDKRRSPLKYGPLIVNQRMDMGFLEYINFCEHFNISPYIVAAYLRHTVQDHLNFLEFLMGDSTTEFGALRAKFGRAKPAKIKYYEIGNEEWLEPTKYAEDFKILYDTIKAKYPDLRIIAAGNHWLGVPYIENQMNILNRSIDIYGWHPAKAGLVNLDLPDTINYLSIVGLPEWAANGEILRDFNTCKKYNDNKDFRVGITEWWSHYGNSVDWTYDTHWRNNSLESGMWDIGMYLGYIKNSEILELTNRTLGMSWINRKVNKNTNKKAIFASVGLKGAIFLNSHRGNKVIPLEVQSAKFNINEKEIAYHFETKYLDAACTYNSDSVYLYLINRSPNKDILVTTDLESKFGSNLQAKKYVLTSNYFLDYLTAEEPNSIRFTTEDVTMSNELLIKPYSFVTFAFANNVLTDVNNDDNTHNNDDSRLIQNYIKLDFNEDYNNVKVYNIEGKLVINTVLKEGQDYLDMQYLSRGFYTAIFSNKNKLKTIRIFKM